ncbi:plastid movement impaired protein [Perilla frutescens var. frutescens]|nr:plastid movement impaired protein [Perilla frutescens var. frutescens]
MGNSLGGSKSAKVMKINGESFKLKTPIWAGSVVERYPGHVLLESEAVKHYGVRAKPLEPQQELKPKRLYFLVELPKFPEEKTARRVRSGIQMSAKDRLESLMLARRSASDLSIMKPPSIAAEEAEEKNEISAAAENGGGVRVRMRLPRAEVERLIAESRDNGEVAEKIVGLCMARSSAAANGGDASTERNAHLNGDRGVGTRGIKSREKRVGFLPINEGEIHHVVMAS